MCEANVARTQLRETCVFGSSISPAYQADKRPLTRLPCAATVGWDWRRLATSLCGVLTRGDLTVAQFHDLRHRLITKAEVDNARQPNQCLLAWAIESFLEGDAGGGKGMRLSIALARAQFESRLPTLCGRLSVGKCGGESHANQTQLRQLNRLCCKVWG